MSSSQGRLAATLLVMALAAAACGQERIAGDSAAVEGTTITFSISVSDDERAAIQELLEMFEDRTKAEVNLEALSRFRHSPASHVRLVTSLDSEGLIQRLVGDAPRRRPTIDLFAQDNLALKPLVDSGLVEDLSGVEIPPTVIPALVPPRFDGKQFFLPFRPNVRLTYLAEESARQAGVDAPGTVDELVGAARELAENAGRPAVTLSLAEGNPAAVTVSEWILSYGGNPLVLNDQGSIAAFEVLRQLWKDNLIARESLFARYDTEVEYLLAGKSVLAQNWSFTSAVLAKEDRLAAFHVYPGWRGPSRRAHVIGGDVLGIARGVVGRRRATAEALARFLMSKEAQEVLVRENAWPSIRPDVYEDVPEAQRQTFEAIQEALANGWFRPSVSYWREVTTQLNAAVNRIIFRQEPVEPVLDELHEKVEAAARAAGEPYPPSP